MKTIIKIDRSRSKKQAAEVVTAQAHVDRHDRAVREHEALLADRAPSTPGMGRTAHWQALPIDEE